ncbi:MAG TPA: hypothetical protein VMD31_07760, partial [Opitutaceae bacterium]|nr:hypothetical protein [Opitutaceae bacterium]
MDPAPTSRRGVGRWPGAALGWLAAALALGTAVYLWALPIPWREATSRTANDYYAWLSDAFLSGQLYLKIEPDPRLKALANPAQVRPDDQIPRLPQASYYHGHYYLYFSALPALLVFIPWRLIFGAFPADGVGIILFALMGWILAAATLWWAWRRWCAGLSGAWLALGVLLMALSTSLVLLVQSPMTHGVPISCAFC